MAGAMESSIQTVLITGASGGLGAALAREFASRGLRVLGCARRADALGELARELGPPHAFEAVDVGDDAAVARWAEGVEAPDLLVNNAALMHDVAPAWEIPAEEFDRLMHVNVGGTMNMIRRFAPMMIARGRGVIANFSSGWARSASPDVAGYCASKWAIEGLTRALALDLPQGIAAVAVNPGIIDTAMLRKCWAEGASAYPAADAWAPRAAAGLLALRARDSGSSVDL